VNVFSNTTPPRVKAEGVSIVALALSLSFMAAILALAFVAWDLKSIAWSVASCRRRAGWAPWLWTLAFGHHEDRTPATSRRARQLMAAFAKSWRREEL
jgi:hypothetical protein